MGATPKTERGRATRARILEAATELVTKHGVGATSTGDVLAVAGVSKSQLYHYFEDKQDLMRAVVAHTTDNVLAAQQPHLGSLSSWRAIEDWFALLVDLQVAGQATGGCPLGSLVAELAEADGRAREMLVESFDRWQGHLATGLQTMREDGRLSATADPDALATAAMASIQGGLLLTQVRRDPNQLRIALEAALAYLKSHAA